jgi:NADPH2:quinone reductase
VRAAVCHSHGPPEVVKVEDREVPEVSAGHARVKVSAASVNYPDVLIVANDYQIKVPAPFVPGSEFAGVVVEVGDDVSGIAPGDRVSGTGIVGAFAEEVVVPAASVTPIPEGVDERAAAAFGVAHRTAYHVLRSVASVQRGEALVVLGAGGGVGLAAVQLGAILGASVTAVASSPEKLEVAAAQGATRLINHRDGDLRQSLRDALPDGSDVVVDPVGGALAEPALRSLGWGGRFVTVGYASGEIPTIRLNLVLLKGIQVLGFEFLSFATHRPDDLHRNERELMELLASGRVTPYVGATFPLDEVAAALRFVADGRAIGKVVLDIGGAR